MKQSLPLFVLASACMSTTPQPDMPLTQVSEIAQTCEAEINDNSLIALDAETLQRFGFERVMSKIVSGSGKTPLQLFQQWWDTNNDAAGAVTDGPHCDGWINGFAVSCPRPEGAFAKENPFDGSGSSYEPLALIHRFDKAPENGADCGEYRVLFSINAASIVRENAIIFEARLPNPTPELGLEGCRPVAELLASLSHDDPVTRADKLERFYFEEVIDARNFGVRGGQVRTRQFVNDGTFTDLTWNMREYQLDETLTMRMVTIKNNPHYTLFQSEDTDFQDAFVAQVATLAAHDLNRISIRMPDRFNAGQARIASVDSHYSSNEVSPTLLDRIQQELDRIGETELTPQHIIRRAETQSCGGCHYDSAWGDIGLGQSWPPMSEYSGRQISKNRISDALRDVFLPHRARVLGRFVGRCDVLGLSSDPIGGSFSTH